MVIILNKFRVCTYYNTPVTLRQRKEDYACISETHEEKDGDVSNRICYTYDHAGNLTSQTDEEGNTTSFTVDAWGRTTSRH